jgi:O-antigen ligase
MSGVIMPDAHAIDETAPPGAVSLPDRLEKAGALALLAMAAALQVSIAAAQAVLTIAVICWLALLVARRERFEAPGFFWPLVLFAGLTLVSAAFSPQPLASLVDSRQLLLLLIVPVTYRLASGNRGSIGITVLVTVGAASAAFGIFQYGILRYDQLAMRPRGLLGHYMTYSGLLMLVIGAALARVLFAPRDRLWAALVMPALAVAVAVSFTRSAWVGACAAAALVLLLKDFRLIAVLPVVAAIFFATAPANITARFVSMFNLTDPTIRDRVAMFHAGQQMVRDHPLVGVGPEMVGVVYPQYRASDAVEPVNPHLHNVPMQIAAERGLPALVAWCWFVAAATIGLAKAYRSGRHRVLAAAGLAVMAAMLTAGLFEYNFGDSEFLMLFLFLITLPFAAARSTAAHPPA